MPAPAPQSDGLTSRLAQTLLSPTSRLVFLVILLAAAGALVLAYQPQHLLTHEPPGRLTGAGGAVVFGLAYGVCTAAFVPRPVLNVAAGALFGSETGTAAALAGTVLGSAITFALGRALGQDALRPMLRARWLTAADQQLSRHGFRSMLLLRLMPGLPFAGCNYAAAVSRMGWGPFLSATALGMTPNTAAYVVAGSRAAAPTSPVFLAAFSFLALSSLVGVVVAWRKRAALRGSPAPPPGGRGAVADGTADGPGASDGDTAAEAGDTARHRQFS